MSDFQVARNGTAKLSQVDGALKVGRNARIESLDGKVVVVSEGAYFEGSAEVNCSLECSKLVIDHGFVKINGDLTVQNSLEIAQSVEVSGETRASIIEVEGRLNSNSISASEIRVNGTVRVEGNLEASKSLEVTGKLRVPGSIKLNDLGITGEARIGGGKISGTASIRGKLESSSRIEFGELVIFGKAELASGCDAKKISTNGKLEIIGDVKSDQIEVQGKTEVKGNCESRHIIVRGNLEVFGSLSISELLESYGTTEVEGTLAGTSVRAVGRLEANQAVFTGDAAVAGRIETEHGLKAAKVSVGSGSRCDGPIIAETVDVGKSALNIAMWQGEWAGQMVSARLIGRATKVDDIYAKDVRLGAGSTAEKIFAENVQLEKGCIVNQITYTGELKMPEGKQVYVHNSPQKVDRLPAPPL